MQSVEATCSVRITRHYGAAPAVVWAALTERDSLARWLGPMADAVSGSVRAFEVERLLELEWNPPHETPSLVRFELRADGDGTVLVLDHRLIDARRRPVLISHYQDGLAAPLEAHLLKRRCSLRSLGSASSAPGGFAVRGSSAACTHPEKALPPGAWWLSPRKRETGASESKT